MNPGQNLVLFTNLFELNYLLDVTGVVAFHVFHLILQVVHFLQLDLVGVYGGLELLNFTARVFEYVHLVLQTLGVLG